MATTLTEYKYGGHDAELRQDIAEVMENQSPLLRVLSFDELTSNDVSRQQMFLDDGDILEHAVNSTWVINNPHWEYRDAPLATLGDSVTVDMRGALASGHSFDRLMARNVEEKSGQLSRTFDKLAVYAGTTANGRLSGSDMKGLLIHIARVESSTTTDLDGWLYTGTDAAAHNTQVVTAAASSGATLTLGMIQRLVTAVPGCTHIMLSQLMHDKLQTLAQASATNLIVSGGKLGEWVEMYGKQRIIINEAIKDNMPDPSSNVTTISTYNYDTGTGDTSPIFAMRLASNKGFCGINGLGMIQVENLANGGVLENLDAKGKRIKAYLGVALRHRKAAAVLCGATYT